VQAAKRKLRVLTVIETELYPALWSVALTTFLPVAASVFIIVFVARKAGSSLRVIFELSTMASVAADNPVLSHKWKVRFGVVVKRGFRPPLRGVATLAALTIAPRMNVVQAMTGNTGGRGVFVMFVGVTLFATGLAMLAAQRKCRLVVVEFNVLPGVFAVTACALGAQSFLVGLICLMTVHAL